MVALVASILSFAFIDGERGGKNQLFLTSGILLGPYPVSKRVKLNFGVGYQVAVLPTKLTLEPLTPMFDHSVLLTGRIDFLSFQMPRYVCSRRRV
jgi:hypothetical protein